MKHIIKLFLDNKITIIILILLIVIVVITKLYFRKITEKFNVKLNANFKSGKDPYTLNLNKQESMYYFKKWIKQLYSDTGHWVDIEIAKTNWQKFPYGVIATTWSHYLNTQWILFPDPDFLPPPMEDDGEFDNFFPDISRGRIYTFTDISQVSRISMKGKSFKGSYRYKTPANIEKKWNSNTYYNSTITRNIERLYIPENFIVYLWKKSAITNSLNINNVTKEYELDDNLPGDIDILEGPIMLISPQDSYKYFIVEKQICKPIISIKQTPRTLKGSRMKTKCSDLINSDSSNFEQVINTLNLNNAESTSSKPCFRKSIWCDTVTCKNKYEGDMISDIDVSDCNTLVKKWYLALVNEIQAKIKDITNNVQVAIISENNRIENWLNSNYTNQTNALGENRDLTAELKNELNTLNGIYSKFRNFNNDYKDELDLDNIHLDTTNFIENLSITSYTSTDNNIVSKYLEFIGEKDDIIENLIKIRADYIEILDELDTFDKKKEEDRQKYIDDQDFNIEAEIKRIERGCLPDIPIQGTGNIKFFKMGEDNILTSQNASINSIGYNKCDKDDVWGYLEDGSIAYATLQCNNEAYWEKNAETNQPNIISDNCSSALDKFIDVKKNEINLLRDEMEELTEDINSELNQIDQEIIAVNRYLPDNYKLVDIQESLDGWNYQFNTLKLNLDLNDLSIFNKPNIYDSDTIDYTQVYNNWNNDKFMPKKLLLDDNIINLKNFKNNILNGWSTTLNNEKNLREYQINNVEHSNRFESHKSDILEKENNFSQKIAHQKKEALDDHNKYTTNMINNYDDINFVNRVHLNRINTKTTIDNKCSPMYSKYIYDNPLLLTTTLNLESKKICDASKIL